MRRTTISSGKKSSAYGSESGLSSQGKASKYSSGGLLIDIFRVNTDNEAEDCEINLDLLALFDEPEKQLVISRKAFSLQHLRSRAGKIMWVQLSSRDDAINLAAKFKVSFFKYQRFPPQKLAEMTSGAINFKYRMTNQLSPQRSYMKPRLVRNGTSPNLHRILTMVREEVKTIKHMQSAEKGHELRSMSPLNSLCIVHEEKESPKLRG